MTKERIQELLLEPFGTLSERERAEIEAFAEKDDEIRRTLAQARAFSGVLRKAQLIRDPGPATWTGFLAGVRARIDKRTPAIPLWRRQPVLVPVLATALLVLILATGRFGPDFSFDYSNGDIEASVPGLGVLSDGLVLTEDDYTSLSDLGVDAASVAQALEVEDIELVSEEIVPESEMDAPPLMDELLVLSDDEIDGLLAELKATHFM